MVVSCCNCFGRECGIARLQFPCACSMKSGSFLTACMWLALPKDRKLAINHCMSILHKHDNFNGHYIVPTKFALSTDSEVKDSSTESVKITLFKHLELL